MINALFSSTALTHRPRAFDNSTMEITVRDLAPGAGIDGDEMLKRSTDSAAMLDYWDQTDTIVDGIKAMRKAREAYLPKFVDEDDKEYSFRLKNTKLTNVYRDIVEGLSSKPFEEEVSLITSGTDDDGKPTTKTVPPQILEFIEDVDGSGNNLTVFASGTFFAGINSAIDWIFVDFPTADANVRTVADAKHQGIRPFWSRVLGRNVLEARTAMIGGKEVLTYMRIFEPGKPDHVRVFERNGGGVTWKLYVKSDKPAPSGKTMFILEAEGVISIGVIPLVPFITGRRDGRTFRIFPAMQDAADLQIELYQQESGLKFVKIMAAYPMLAGNGISPPTGPDGKTPLKLAVGPGKVLYGKPNANGNHGEWAFVEPSATTMTFLATDVKATIENLREIGRQPLTAQSANVTVINSAVAAGKARTAVGAWALQLKDALENAMLLTCKWYDISDYEPEVNVYTEFDDFADGNADLTELGAARTRKDLSQETYWSELKRRKVLSPEFNAEAERERLLNELPAEGLDDDIEDDKTGKITP